MQLPREEVMGALAAAQPGWAPYYEHRLSPRCSVAVLDTTEVSLQGPLIDEARAFLAQRPRPPEALSANGGVGPAQLAWLRDDVLRRARAEGRRVIVAGHNPLLAEASRPGGYTRAFGRRWWSSWTSTPTCARSTWLGTSTAVATPAGRPACTT